MKKLIAVIGLATSILFTSCSLFVRTKHVDVGGSVGSTQPVHPAPAAKTAQK